MKPVIEVNGLSKKYEISHLQKASYHTLKDDFGALVKKPASLITRKVQKKEEFWALKDVNFKVNQGDIVGVIGKNGSGKSTLLKILSRIVDPTEGEIRMRGKVASLLEVGTGFHAELTGRENIYFNGSILGMKRGEIDAKFNDIVEFSGVENFLDTPVKFYSSGMYVRLAFAVAAHLEPEILIIDEVLAVGDAEFQKKSLGKMSSVAKEGRTVIFVSHSMAAVRQLCQKGILLDGGRAKTFDKVEEAIWAYQEQKSIKGQRGHIRIKNHSLEIYDFQVNGKTIGEYTEITSGTELKLSFKYKSGSKKANLNFGYGIRRANDGILVAFSHAALENFFYETKARGEIMASYHLPLLAPDSYSLEFHLWINDELIITEEEVCGLVIPDIQAFASKKILTTFPSVVLVSSEWEAKD